MKKQQHTEVYLDGMDTPTQYVSIHIGRIAVEGSAMSRQQHEHRQKPNGHTEQMDTQAGATGINMPTGVEYQAANPGSTDALGNKQPISFERRSQREDATVYQRQILLGQVTPHELRHIHTIQTPHFLGNQGVTGQKSAESRMYLAPVHRPQSSTKRPRRRLRAVVGLLSRFACGGWNRFWRKEP